MIASGRHMILIRMRVPSHGNYRGILQKYALQRILVQLGLESIIDLARGDEARAAEVCSAAISAVECPACPQADRRWDGAIWPRRGWSW